MVWDHLLRTGGPFRSRYAVQRGLSDSLADGQLLENADDIDGAYVCMLMLVLYIVYTINDINTL